jgi:hypothetical protein
MDSYDYTALVILVYRKKKQADVTCVARKRPITMKNHPGPLVQLKGKREKKTAQENNGLHRHINSVI